MQAKNELTAIACHLLNFLFRLFDHLRKSNPTTISKNPNSQAGNDKRCGDIIDKNIKKGKCFSHGVY